MALSGHLIPMILPKLMAEWYPNTITEDELDHLREKFVLPIVFRTRIPLTKKRCYTLKDSEEVCLPLWDLQVGLSLHVHPVVHSILKGYGVNLTQFPSNAYGKFWNL